MKFCTKCGAPVEDGKRFCSKCGQPISGQTSAASNTSVQTEKTEQTVRMPVQETPIEKAPNQGTQTGFSQTINKLNKKQKIGIIAGTAALVLLIAGYAVGANLTSRDKVVSKFEQALVSNNTKQLGKYIVSSDPKLKIDSKSLEPLANFFKKNPSYRNDIVKSINKQSQQMSLYAGTLAASASSDESGELFTLKKQGKTWLVFDRYVFAISPVYFRLHTNYKDTNVFVENNKVCTSDTDDFTKEIGPYVPGLYEMKASLAGKYVNLENTFEINTFMGASSSSGNQNIFDEDLSLNGYTPSIDSDYKDAELFINGKDTGLKISDAQNVGPLSKDGSVKLYAQKDFPWGTVKGEETAADGSNPIYLKLSGVDDGVKSTLMDTINSFNKSWIEAYSTLDASKVVNVSDAMKQTFSDQIQSIKNNNESYTGSITKTVFDLDSISTYQNDGKYYAKVIDNEFYNDALYYNGTSASPTDRQAARGYTLIYDETSKKWLVDGEYDNYYFDSQNTKEFDF